MNTKNIAWEKVEKTYGYIPVAVHERIEAYNDESLMIAAVDEFFETFKKDMTAELQSLDEEIAIYKGLAAKRAVAFKSATNEILENAQDLWETWDRDMPSYYKKIKEVREAVKGVRDDFAYMERMVSNFDLNRLERVLAVLNEIDAMSDKNKELLLAILARNEE